VKSHVVIFEQLTGTWDEVLIQENVLSGMEYFVAWHHIKNSLADMKEMED
jgi:hypothetical protein